MSQAGLSVAARHADIVGFAGLRQVRGAQAGTFTLCTAQETALRVRQVRELAGGRAYRSDVLVQMVVLGEDPADAARRIAGQVPDLTAAQILDSPFVLLARDAAEAAAALRQRHQEYGFDSVTTYQPSMEALGQVIAAYRPPAL